MKIIENFEVPTGNILIVEGDKGKLEMLSIGDYGQAVNLNQNKEVPSGLPIMPLTKKWVITISTQYGCSMNCKFCFLPDAPILMSNYTYKNISNINIGDIVISNLKSNENSPVSDYATLTTTEAYVIGVIKRIYNGKMYIINTEDGHKIICTEEHPIATKYNTRYRYIPAKNISQGDYIITTNHIVNNYENIDWRLGWIYGFLLGDGVYDEIDGRRWMVAQKYEYILKEHKNILEDLGIHTTNIWTTDDHKGHKGYRYAIQGQWVDKLDKLINNAEKTNLFKIGFIAGFWDAEGYSFKNNQCVRVCNKTEYNIDLFKEYINDLGYTCSIYKNNNNIFTVNVSISRDNFNALFTPIHIKRRYLNYKNSKSFCKCSKVYSVDTFDYKGLVYNIETSTHNYYGYDVLTHNCDVPKVGRGINATFDDLIYQVLTGMSIHPEIKYTERLNIHYARMGEPTFNHNVLTSAMWLTWLKFNLDNRFKIHPVVSTMMPNNNKHLIYFLKEWMRIKNEVYDGDAGLQLSINSTDEQERNIMFSGHSLTLEETSSITKNLIPKGRKITLNFAIANYTINPEILLKYFNPDYFICKLTPMHKTKEALHNNIKTEGNYTQPEPYREVEYNLNKAGYETLIFIASNDEDLGRITCGNALLSGTRPFD